MRSYPWKNAAKIRSFGSEITEGPCAEHPVWMVTKYVILARFKLRCFDQSDWEIISEVFPYSQSSHEVRAPSSMIWSAPIDEVCPGKIKDRHWVIGREKQSENYEGAYQSAEVERVVIKRYCCGLQAAVKGNAERCEFNKRHLVQKSVRCWCS